MSEAGFGTFIFSMAGKYDLARREVITADEKKEIDQYTLATHNTVMNLMGGIQAIGELLAWGSEAGEISEQSTRQLGWFLKEVGGIAEQLHDECIAASMTREVLRVKNPEHPE